MDFARSFDGILFAYSLAMIPDWEAALERACAHLRPDGRLVVLDFATFDGWGPLGAAMRRWLRVNHVETQRPYAQKLQQLLTDLRIRRTLGGYSFTAVGTKKALHKGQVK